MKLFVLTNPLHVGDNNQILGTAKAIQETLEFETELVSIAETEFSLDSYQDNDLILVAGDHGLRLAEKLKIENSKATILMTGHLYFPEFQTMTHWPDFVALPESALSEHAETTIREHSQLIITKGVAHNVDEDSVFTEAIDFKHPKSTFKEPAKGSLQIGIVLGGDAPNEEGNWQLFSEEDAKKQATLIANRIKAHPEFSNESVVLITNCPRTGKYDALTQQEREPNPHTTSKLDPVSLAFFSALRAELPLNDNLEFHSFQFAQKPSAYKPMMQQMLSHPRSMWFVPAESTSMVTESSLLKTQGIEVFVYYPASTNAAHRAHVNDCLKMGLLSDVTDFSKNEKSERSLELASKTIASTVVETPLMRSKSQTRLSFRDLLVPTLVTLTTTTLETIAVCAVMSYASQALGREELTTRDHLQNASLAVLLTRTASWLMSSKKEPNQQGSHPQIDKRVTL